MEIRTIEPFLKYFGNVRERTMRVAHAALRSEEVLQRFEGGPAVACGPGRLFPPSRSTAA
jgi:hypothetical protein